MFPGEVRMFPVQKHMFPVQKHKFSAQKQKIPFETISFSLISTKLQKSRKS